MLQTSGSIVITRNGKILKDDVSRTGMKLEEHSLLIRCFTVDYNSWVESEKALKLASSLDKNVVLAEGKIHAAKTIC